MPVPQIRSHNFWRYINLYVCMDGRGFKGICLLVHVVYVMCVVGTEAGRPETATDADTRRKQTTHQGNKSPTVFSGHLFWRGGAEFRPHQKDLQFPPRTGKLCALNLFLAAGTTNYHYITETFFYRTINTGNYSSLLYSH